MTGAGHGAGLERRCLQAAMAIIILVPILAAAQGIPEGIGRLGGRAPRRSLAGHLRYLPALPLAMRPLAPHRHPAIAGRAPRRTVAAATLTLLAIPPATC